MTKTVKIGIAVALVVVAIIVVYLVMRKSYAGNKYGSAAAVKAGKTGQYGTFADSTPESFNKLFTPALGLPQGDWGNGNTAQDGYGNAWFKGMDIARTNETIDLFKSDLVKYATNASLRKPHWEVTTGEFLKPALPALS